MSRRVPIYPDAAASGMRQEGTFPQKPGGGLWRSIGGRSTSPAGPPLPVGPIMLDRFRQVQDCGCPFVAAASPRR
jgi:hypothetical protein